MGKKLRIMDAKQVEQQQILPFHRELPRADET